MLLQFVAGKDDQPPGLELAEHVANEPLAERARAARDQDILTIEVNKVFRKSAV